MEKRYQGKWNTIMIGDYCWCLKMDHDKAINRMSRKRHFIQYVP